ncbi:unnamed protein product [Leptosia nina]|uniref:Amino acid transporter transmembrane domain-containing protein n=1 Tax=Leptosia nina TaxID=320188 RepID=A0AAV1JII3_9NEOP
MVAWDKCVFALIILNVHAAFSESLVDSIRSVVKGNSNPPIVVRLNFKQRSGTIYDFAQLDDTTEANERSQNHDAINDTGDNDEGAYLLYHLLRTTQENEDLDESATRTFEKTKDMLRAALRSRCNKYDRCVRRCVKVTYSCTVTCREVYDMYDICRQPICGSACWGRLDSLLSRLYEKAQSSYRPLIVILDNSYLKERVQKPDHQEVSPLLSSSEEIVHIEPPLAKLNKKPRKSTRQTIKPIIKSKNRFRARNALAQRSRIQSPIVKSLLRISNDLRCNAKEECVDECKIKFIGIKIKKCIITCEIYECKEEEVDSCRGDECKNSCESDCEEQAGSTKEFCLRLYYKSCVPWCEHQVEQNVIPLRQASGKNLVESTAHYVKGCLGAGLLGIHEGFMYGGLWASLGATAFLGFLVPYCTYVLEAVSPTIKNSNLDISIYIIIITIPLVSLCLIRSLKYLAPFSLIADLFIAICVITSLYYSISVVQSIRNVPSWKSIHGLLRFCGVCIYSIDGIGVSLPIENNMRRPQYFDVVLQCGMAIVIPLVAMVGFFGYWAWGEHCRTPITIHMPPERLRLLKNLSIIAVGVILCGGAIYSYD